MKVKEEGCGNKKVAKQNKTKTLQLVLPMFT